MSYTPNNWTNGDTITAQKLNNTESQVQKNERLDIPVTLTIGEGTRTATTTMTFAEAKTAYVAGRDLRMVVTVTGGGILLVPIIGADAADPTSLIFAVASDFGDDGEPDPSIDHFEFSADGIVATNTPLSVAVS